MGNSFPGRRQQQTKRSSWTPVFAAVLLLLTVVSFFNYLLFHSAAEIFSIVIAFAMFTFCWNCRQFLRDNYLQFLGIAYLFVGTLDLTHTLAFPGLNVFGQGGLNLAAQIWLSARVLEAASLLAAAHLLGRKIPPAPVFALYSITVGVLLYAVFTQNVAPVWDPETEQLTAFKKLSEYIISVTLLGALGVFYRKRNKLNKGVLAFLAISIIGTVLSEISFTAFRNADDPMNWLGHMLKIISFYFLYKAVIETGLRRPFALLFRDLEKNRSTIQQERALLEAVLQEMPDAIVTTDAEGETILANRAYSELIAPEGASPESSRRFFYQNGKPCPPSEVPLQRSLRTGEPMRNEQLEIRRGDGSFRTVLCHATPVRDQQGDLVAVVAAHHDITERKRMEDALREARNRLEERVKERTRQLAAAEEQQRALANQWEETFDAMQDMVAIITPERKIANANRTMADFFGQSREELKGTDCSELMQCRPVTSRNCPLEKSLKTNKRESSERFMKNRWFLVSADPVSDDEGAMMGCVHILRDITAEKKAERKIRRYQDQLRELTSELSLAEERERRRLSAALHDSIAQTLALSKMKLGSIRNLVESQGPREELDELGQYLDDAIKHSRSLMFELSPPILYDVGLAAALDKLTAKIADRYELDAACEIECEPENLGKDISVILFQSARELLMNVVKHADSDKVALALQCEDETVKVTVNDDGKGFETSAGISPDAGFGLFHIQERLDRLGGKLVIDSQPGMGTKVTLSLPIDN